MKWREQPFWKFCKAYRSHLLLTLCAVVVALCIPFEAYYQRQFQAPELEILPEAEGAVALVEESTTALVCQGGEAYEGILAKSENITLPKGSYTLQVVSLSEEEGNYLEIYEPGRLNPDNTQGALLKSAELKVNQEITEISFTLEESMTDICIRIGYGGKGSLNLNGFYLTSAKRLYTDSLCLAGAIVLVSLLLLIRKMRGAQKDAQGRRAAILLTAAVLAATLPLSYDFLLDGNDLYYQFNRILGMQEGLKSGQLPVKIHSTLLHGYGYGSSIFYPELFLYPAALLGCMGVSLIGCYKALLLMINGATAMISYFSFSGVLGSRKKGLIAAVFYTLSIYRLIDLYTRAAVGEAMAMIFLPLVLWGMYELFLGNYGKWYLAVLGYSGIMQSHVLSTELALFFGCIFGVCHIGRLREKGRLKAVLLAAGGTVLLNLGVILPLLQHAAYPFRVFAVESTLSWWTATLPKIFDIVLANPAERTYAGMENGGEMPIAIGFPLLVGSLLFLYCYVREEKKTRALKNTMFAMGLGIFGIYLSTSLFPWDRVQGISVLHRLVTSIQIPWRFLALSTALLCPVCAEGFFRLSGEREVQKGILAGALALAFLCSGIYVNRYCEEASVRYTYMNQYQREQSQVDALYFMEVEHANSYRIWNRENTFVAAKGVELQDCQRGEDLTAGFRYRYSADEALGEQELWVDVPFTYYPNYRASLKDGTLLRTDVGEQGVLRVYLPAAETESITVTYREPWYVVAGRVLSACGFLALLIFIRWEKRGNSKKAVY